MSARQRRFQLLIIYTALVLPFVVYGSWRAMQINANSPIDWVPDSFPPRHDYDRFRAAFGAGDVLVVSWPGCTVDEPSLDRFAYVLRKARAFHDEQGRWYFERVMTGRSLLKTLHAAPIGLSRSEALRRLTGTLIGPDGHTTAAVVTFTAAGLQHRRQLVALIRGAMRQFCHVPTGQWHLAGPVMDGLSVDRAGKRATSRFAVLSALVVLVVCWWCLRSLALSLLVFGLSVLAQGITLSLVHYNHDTMSALLIVMPPLIQVLAVAGGIHLVNYYLDAARDPRERAPARQALRLGWLPCVLSAGTTAVGLASLMVSQLTPIRAFGAYASIGVMATAGLLLAFIPGTFAVMPAARRRSNTNAGRPRALSKSGRGWLILSRILERGHGPIAVVSLGMMLVVGWGILNVNTSVRIETLFPSDSRILTDYRWLEQHVGPLVPIEVVLTCDRSCRLTFRERLRLASRVEHALRKLDAVGGTMSAATFAPQFPRRPDLPQTMYHQKINQQLRKNRSRFAEANYLHATKQGEELRITAYVSALRKMDYGRFLRVVRGTVSPLLPRHQENHAAGVTARYTGIMPLVHNIQHQLMNDLFKSFLSAFVVITVTMTLVQGGLAAGLVSMVSNIFPTLLMFGTLGWWKMPMDIGSVMTASVALGIAVDDTLHFLTFFRRGLDAGHSRRRAVRFAYRHCGTAMIQTSLICGLGLLVFAGSDFVPVSRFAWMMVSLMAAALFGDLIVLPSLLLGPLGDLFRSHPATNQDTSEDNSPTHEAPAGNMALPISASLNTESSDSGTPRRAG